MTVSGPRQTERLRGDVDADLARAADLLRAGKLVALPTETVYGLAAAARDPDAVAGIFAAKQRPSFDPLIVHVLDASDVDAVADVAAVGAHFGALAEAFWPGPLTLVLPRRDVPDIVTSGLDTVAVRVPAHPVMRAVLQRAGLAVAAPSANPFGYVSPTTADHVFDALDGRIDAVVDGGPCAVGVESTIVSLVGDAPEVLRYGGVDVADLEAVVGPVRRGVRVLERPLAPGQLARHYATRVPLRLVTGPRDDVAPGTELLVLLGDVDAAPGYARVERLAADGDPRHAAARLFAALRDIDARAPASVDVVACDEAGLGAAIMDRIRRAAVP